MGRSKFTKYMPVIRRTPLRIQHNTIMTKGNEISNAVAALSSSVPKLLDRRWSR